MELLRGAAAGPAVDSDGGQCASASASCQAATAVGSGTGGQNETRDEGRRARSHVAPSLLQSALAASLIGADVTAAPHMARAAAGGDTPLRGHRRRHGHYRPSGNGRGADGTPPDIDMYGHLAACNFTKVCIALWRECPAEGPPFSRPLVDEECCKACVTPDHC